MLNEILKFASKLTEDFYIPKTITDEGLYAVIPMNESVPNSEGIKFGLVVKKEPIPQFLLENNIPQLAYLSSYIDMNKCLDMGQIDGTTGKKIHGTNAYSLIFKAKELQIVQKRLLSFYEKAVSLLPEEGFESQRESIQKIKDFTIHTLIPKLLASKEFSLLTKKGKDDEEVKEYIKIFYLVPTKWYEDAYKLYLKKNLFDKEDSGKDFGTNTFMARQNQKKPFVQPQTPFFKSFFKTSFENAITLEKLKKAFSLKPTLLPNPLPVFIDEAELETTIRLVQEDGRMPFREVFKRLYQNKPDINNYYLIYWLMTKDGLVFHDYDYVSNFSYLTNQTALDDFFSIKEERDVIKTVFDLEIKVFNKIFDNKLIGIREGGVHLNYFGKFEQKGLDNVLYQLILQHRKNIYDYIYKSRNEAISRTTIYDIIMQLIRNELSNKVVEENKKSTSGKQSKINEFVRHPSVRVRELLNILFSTNIIFDSQQLNFGGRNMASKLPEYTNVLKEIILNDANVHLNDDYLFAFAAGQMVFFLHYQSEAKEKTLSMLEPFVTKSSVNDFKAALLRTLYTYKHAIGINHKRFRNLSSEVLAYESNVDFKTLLPAFYSGYFSNQILLISKEELNEGDTNE